MKPDEPFDGNQTSSDEGRTTEALSSATETTPRLIGHYQLLQKIGEGGMGEVWLAEQKEPVRRRVALKLVKAGMNSREVIGRFESERQALALMDHPAIAKVFEAGSTEQDAPYFVMEYVAGVPINEYCDRHRLSIEERLELFLHVCEGVRHAHQKAIIHRDLKPSNILVVEVDGKPAPKIIDFGVAKALSQKLTPHTMFTRVGSLIGTPEYMSPEQALSWGEDVDTRSDVYSLGIIFYELLAGAPPIELRKLAFDEFMRRLRDEEPPKPSTKIKTQDPETSSELAQKRQTEPVALVKQIGGDLDSIALKALEKDRSRRYGSAADLAADIARYLTNEPVLAVAPSAVYRFGKFARRHRGALATACAFLLVLTAATAVSIRQGMRANREAAVAQAVSDFLRNDLLAQASASTQAGPNRKPDPDLKVRTALDRAAEGIQGKFGKQPEVEAAIRDTIGRTYLDLSLFPEARTQLERALALHQQTEGVAGIKTLATARALGMLALNQGRLTDAEKIMTETLAAQRRVLGPENRETLNSMTSLEAVYGEEGKLVPGEALAAQEVEIRRRLSGPESPDTLSAMNNLALFYHDLGKYDESEKMDIQIVEARKRVLGAEHPDTLASMNNLAITYSGERKYAEAEKLDKEILETKLRVLGPEHVDTLMTMNNLGVVYRFEGKYALAETLDVQTLETRRRILGAEHPNTLQSMHNAGADAYMDGKYAQAEELLSQTVEIRKRTIGAKHPKTLLSMNMLADVYTMESKFGQAEALLDETLETSKSVLGAEHPTTIGVLADKVFLDDREGNFKQGDATATQVLEIQRRNLGANSPSAMSAAMDVAMERVMEKKFVEAEPPAREALGFFQKTQPEDSLRFIAESLVGASLAGQEKYTEAEPLLVEGNKGLASSEEALAVPYRGNVERAREWLVGMYVAWGKPEKAAEFRRKQK